MAEQVMSVAEFQNYIAKNYEGKQLRVLKSGNGVLANPVDDQEIDYSAQLHAIVGDNHGMSVDDFIEWRGSGAFDL